MPEQLIFTSNPTGIQPGRSGFQVVAQHESINNRLIIAIEKESIYEFADSSQTLPIICKHFKFEFGEERFSVLTRIQSCGIDFTGRPNHIAHHLIFNDKEIPNCPPAALFTLWKGWRGKWGKPRYLGEWDRVNYENDSQPFNYSTFALPAKTWYTYTNDEGCAALPLFSEREMVAFPLPEGKEDALTWLFFESQNLMNPKDAWEITFTNYLSENDNPLRFNWIGLPKTKMPAQLSYDCEILDVFTLGNLLVAPEQELADKARNPPPTSEPVEQKKTSTVSIAPIEEDSDYVQDELVLGSNENAGASPVDTDEDSPIDPEDESSNFLEDVGSLFGRHANETFEDIFPENDDDEKIVIPDIDLSEAEGDVVEKRSVYRMLLLLIKIAGILGVIASIIFLSPYLIELINRSMNPAPIEQPPTTQDKEQSKRIEAAKLDPASRFASQLGEVDSIMQNGQFLMARAYLSNYRNDPTRSKTEGYLKLDRWFEEQKTILGKVNRETGRLEKEIAEKRVLFNFDDRVEELYDEIKKLALDLQPSLEKNLKEQETIYREWLNIVRLKTENAPTFFIPISKENPNPVITFSKIHPKVLDWMIELDHFQNTSQLEHIQIQLSPFKGLNQFQLSPENAIDLSVWKQNERSLLSYLDGQLEVVEIISKINNPEEVTFAWRFQQGELKSESKSIGIFPEPPLILNFLNTLTKHSLSIVMMGGISLEDTAPAEIPLSFLHMVPGEHRFELLDPVLKEKLNLFIFPPGQFLRMRSSDSRYHFAWNNTTSDFHLYESINLESRNVKNVQAQISQEHKILNELNRKQTIFESLTFIQESPLWTLGRELLHEADCPPQLETFGNFIQNTPESYFQYLREILTVFADKYTLIRPSIMQQWLAYPNNQQPDSKGSVYAYRNLLLRTSKRFRSLLEEEDATSLENWRSFVTNLEFWLLGEYQEQLLDILSLHPEDIAAAQSTDLEAVRKEISETESVIADLQASLDEQSNLSEINDVKQWLVEIASLESNDRTIPLILFQ